MSRENCLMAMGTPFRASFIITMKRITLYSAIPDDGFGESVTNIAIMSDHLQPITPSYRPTMLA